MADKKITELTEATSASTDDLLVMVDSPAGGAETKRITVGNLLLSMYPVGAIYISVVDTSPATLFGGTWSVFGEGKTLVGYHAHETEFDTIEETGGAKTHTLSLAELPTHGVTMSMHGDEAGSIVRQFSADGGGTSGGTTINAYRGQSAPVGGATSIQSASVSWGSGTAHNNLQPYITTYMWKRTA
jgi:hypothetical protein